MRTLLVANRGEIARRILRSARSMGLRTVALHSADDADAPHVAEADLALGIDEPGAAAYLDVEALPRWAAAVGADAVHPGYGFLAERADAARAVVAAGLTWVGPHPEAIATLGAKRAAKAAAARAGLPLLPGGELLGDDPDAWLGAIEAAELGWPVLLKASAGGGGRGMRLVDAPEALAAAVLAARREALASFGDATVFAERLVERARHIEIQVAGDADGRAIHLGERECSIQRRHQKVVEEAPSPAIGPARRQEMGDAAVALAQAIGYDSLGTVELVVDADADDWWFLEMNTRLQVEHPVTEAVTGLDLVRLQLDLADGGELPLTQDQVRLDGHALEVRLVAEDPSRGWLPSTGTIHRWRPDPDDGVRWDAAVADGTVIGTGFDSLLAKGIVHAPDRTEAARRLARSLRRLSCQGVATNRDLLVRTLEEPDFLDGDLHTGFLDAHPRLSRSRWDRLGDELPDRWPASLLGVGGPDDESLCLTHPVLAVAWLAATERRSAPWPTVPVGWRIAPADPPRTGRLSRPDEAPSPWDAPGPSWSPVEVDLTVDGEPATVRVAVATDPGAHAVLGCSMAVGVEHRLGEVTASGWQVVSVDDDHIAVRIPTPDGTITVRADVHRAGDHLWVGSPSGETEVVLTPRLAGADASSGSGDPAAPVPGTVLEVAVGPGDRVEPGQVLVVLEAMKVEHRIAAPDAGVVTEVLVAAGDSVDARQPLVRLEVDG